MIDLWIALPLLFFSQLLQSGYDVVVACPYFLKKTTHVNIYLRKNIISFIGSSPKKPHLFYGFFTPTCHLHIFYHMEFHETVAKNEHRILRTRVHHQKKHFSLNHTSCPPPTSLFFSDPPDATFCSTRIQKYNA